MTRELLYEKVVLKLVSENNLRIQLLLRQCFKGKHEWVVIVLGEKKVHMFSSSAFQIFALLLGIFCVHSEGKFYIWPSSNNYSILINTLCLHFCTLQFSF